ncbi:MAG: TonB-dependent receptor [Sphingopyxis sp.]|nr:TonB-dependent receptor [Sphingopyxis sp.]
MRSALLLALASSASLLPAAALAQTETPPAEQASPTDGSELGDIIVTARRREENLQSVPIAVTAFTQEGIAQKGITDRTSLADNTPSLFTINGGYPREAAFFALRGQGPAFGSTPGVLNYFAEVPNSVNVDGRVGTYFDLANIQVLSGPQGTLFGKNATGGNILFEPVKPKDEFEGYVRVQLGNYDDRRIEGALNTPIVPGRVLLRIAGEVGRRDGYTRDVGPNFAGKDYDNLSYESFRFGLTLRPTDNIELYTMLRYYQSANNGGGTVIDAFNPAAGADLGPPFGFIPVLAFHPGAATIVSEQRARGPRRVSYDLNQFSRTEYWQVINQASIELTDNIKLRNIISYSQFRNRYGYDYDATPFPLAGQSSRNIDTLAPNTFTEELQLQGTLLDDAIDFAVGGYLDRTTTKNPAGIEQYTFFPIGTLIPPIFGYFDNRNRSEAIFGQATVNLGKLSGALTGLSVTGGLRYTWEHSFTSQTIGAPPAVSGSVDSKYPSYTATLDYDVTPGVHVYVTARDAYKSGGVNGPVPTGSAFRTFPPERLSDIEFGVKSQFSIGAMDVRANVAAYRGMYDNIQRTTVESVQTPSGPVLLNVTRSAAKGRIQGVELNVAVVPARGFTLNGSYSYIDARYTVVADASAGAILNGAPFPYTPKHKYSIGGSYETPMGGAGDLVLAVNYVRQTKVSTAQTNSSFYNFLPAYGLLNASVGLRDVGGRPIDLTLFATNITDEAKPVGVLDQYAGSSGTVGLTYTEPRMYGVRIGYRFGS